MGTGFPLWAEWTAAIIGGAAFLLAVQPFTQFIWGRPKLDLEFDRYVEGQNRLLVVLLKNPPISSKILNALRISRNPIQSLVVHFRIAEHGSGRIEITNRQARIYTDTEADDSGRWRISLPPTFSGGANVVVARWDTDIARTVVPPTLMQNETHLAVGLYRAQIVFLIDGKEKTVSRQFVVGEGPDDLVWSRV